MPLSASPIWRRSPEREVINMRQTQMIFLAAIAGLAWLTFAEHPSAKNFRTALVDTLPFV